jgi:amino-acid N-acetyltransferase
VKIDFAAYDDWPKIKTLLRESGLPHEDIKTAQLKHFLVVRDGERIAGVVGLEPCGTVALIRSLAVAPAYRRFGFASQLFSRIEEYAKTKGVEDLYLLTMTAAGFFEKRGYKKIDRKDVPEAIRAAPEFGGL